jgi:ribosomal protein S27E
MPERRTIACPSCGAERVTKAGKGTRLRCDGCNQMFRAPAPGEAPTGETVTPPAYDAGGSPRPSVTVERPTTVVVEEPPPPVLEDGETDASLADEDDASPPVETRAQQLGRKGGLGYYERKVRRRAS